jgi:hypothetical protein
MAGMNNLRTAPPIDLDPSILLTPSRALGDG